MGPRYVEDQAAVAEDREGKARSRSSRRDVGPASEHSEDPVESFKPSGGVTFYYCRENGWEQGKQEVGRVVTRLSSGKT